MGFVKQLQIREAEIIIEEIEDVIEQIEEHVGEWGYLHNDLLYKLCELYLAYAKIYPDDDMREFGEMFITAMKFGRDTYEAEGRYDP
jgi:hypothetical protein